MSGDVSPSAGLCPACHAQLRAGDEKCWLCGEQSAAPSAAAGEPMPPASSLRPKPGNATSFSLATLMLFMTLVAIVCGVFSLAPGLGAVLAVVLLPVMTHTVISVRRAESLGGSLATEDQIAMFFGSLGLIVVAGIAAGITFAVTCAGGFFAGATAGEALGAKGYDPIGWGAAVGLGLGAIAGAYVGYRAIVHLSKKSKWRNEEMPPLSLRNKMVLAAATLLAIIGAMVAMAWVS